MPRSRTLQVLALLASLCLVPMAAFAGITTADLSITKTDGAASSTPGTQVVYTIVATNSGPSDVTGATVADTFPAALTCTWTCTASAGSSCTAAGAGDIADSVDLLNGGTATYTATCDISPSATGSLDNTATVSSPLMDPTPGNDSATDSNALTPMADLVLAASVTPNPVGVGDPFTVNVTVDNDGPSDATGVVVVTTLPAWATFTETAGCVEDPAGVPTCTLGTIPAGGSAAFSIVAEATVQDDEPIVLAVSSNTPDPTPANDTETMTVTVEGAPVLEIPTTSQLGQLLLGLMLMAGAFWALRR